MTIDTTVKLLSASYKIMPRKRVTHCQNGHFLSSDNVYAYGKSRSCKICHNQRTKDRKAGIPKFVLSKDEKFFSFVSPEPMSGCWLWTGPVTSKDGYGDFVHNNEREGAHRFSYRRFVGTIPEGMLICHKCDNPSCVNPQHLFLGTYKDNAADAKKKLRHTWGERQSQSKLTVVNVREILTSPEASSSLAKKFGVGHRHINYIRARRLWKEVSVA